MSVEEKEPNFDPESTQNPALPEQTFHQRQLYASNKLPKEIPADNELKARSVLDEDDMVRTLLSAIRSMGCPFLWNRHVSFGDACSNAVYSGYDPENKQVVICQSLAESLNKKILLPAFRHELVHMFDHCRANTNFSKLQHLACTEIRAANLVHCKSPKVMKTSLFDIRSKKGMHKVCVKQYALEDMANLRPQLKKEELIFAIDSVFDRCYQDLEPFGRRVREDSNEPSLVYKQLRNYGYYDNLDI